MQSGDIPVKFQKIFAGDASGTYVAYPVPSSAPAAGRASLSQGFPPETFQPVASGGNPPWGADMNGILKQTTAWLQWMQAGGAVPAFDATFSGQIGGYPNGSMVRANGTPTNGLFFLSTANNNTVNPNTGANPANWVRFPDRAIQIQAPNYAAATGGANANMIVLVPGNTTFAQLVGAPIRFKKNGTNTTSTPTIQINGDTAALMVNPDNSAIGIGQLLDGVVVEGIPRDDGKFQVNTPTKIATASTAFITGWVYIWPGNATVITSPPGTYPVLECDGTVYNSADYPALFAILGDRYGGNGTSTFAVPDYRGMFMRGMDHGRNLDAGPRTANHTGGQTGDHNGTVEGDTAGHIEGTGTIAVSVDFVTQSENPTPGSGITSGFEPAPSALGGTCSFSGNVGSTETRPVNTNVVYVIAI